MKNNILILFAALAFSCVTKNAQLDESVTSTIQESQQKYAPDKRVAVFKINAEMKEDVLHLSGASDQKEGVKELVDNLKNEGYNVDNQIELLPHENLGKMTFGLINNSVANIRSRASHSAELGTQALLGTAVKILKKEGEWYLIQTPDDYISWVDHGGITVFESNQYPKWKSADKVIYTEVMGQVFSDKTYAAPVSDIVLGCKLELLSSTDNSYKVKYPDGRLGFIRKNEAEIYSEWLKEHDVDTAFIRSITMKLMGIPYLWGGTSTKGMDCSGFTKTVYNMMGYVIPRDASQQVYAGEIIDANNAFEDLEIGDLLFFGKSATDSTKQRTTHVGIWIGNDEFIHASMQVRVSSINPDAANYDEYNKNRYLGSRRYLGNFKGNIVDLNRKEIARLI